MNFQQTDSATFVEARNKNRRQVYLTPYQADSLELRTAQCQLDEAQQTGYAILSTGELVNLFNNGLCGGGTQALAHAIQHGAMWLTAFEGYLTHWYTKHGFVEIDRLAFDQHYAPKDWDTLVLGTPDVITMQYRKGQL